MNESFINEIISDLIHQTPTADQQENDNGNTTTNNTADTDESNTFKTMYNQFHVKYTNTIAPKLVSMAKHFTMDSKGWCLVIMIKETIEQIVQLNALFTYNGVYLISDTFNSLWRFITRQESYNDDDYNYVRLGYRSEFIVAFTIVWFSNSISTSIVWLFYTKFKPNYCKGIFFRQVVAISDALFDLFYVTFPLLLVTLSNGNNSDNNYNLDIFTAAGALTSNTALTFLASLLPMIFLSLKADATLTLMGNDLRQIMANIHYTRFYENRLTEKYRRKYKAIIKKESKRILDGLTPNGGNNSGGYALDELHGIPERLIQHFDKAQSQAQQPQLKTVVTPLATVDENYDLDVQESIDTTSSRVPSSHIYPPTLAPKLGGTQLQLHSQSTHSSDNDCESDNTIADEEKLADGNGNISIEASEKTVEMTSVATNEVTTGAETNVVKPEQKGEEDDEEGEVDGKDEILNKQKFIFAVDLMSIFGIIVGIFILIYVLVHFTIAIDTCNNFDVDNIDDNDLELKIYEHCRYKVYPFNIFKYSNGKPCNCRMLVSDGGASSETIAKYGVYSSASPFLALQKWDMLEIFIIKAPDSHTDYYDAIDSQWLIDLSDSSAFNAHHMRIFRIDLWNLKNATLNRNIGNYWSSMELFAITEANIDNIPDSIENMKLLKFIDFDYNNIKIFNKAICELTEMRGISLRRTLVETVPDCILQLTKLQSFYVTLSPVKSIPYQLFNLPSLIEIDLILTNMTYPFSFRGLSIDIDDDDIATSNFEYDATNSNYWFQNTDFCQV